MSTTIDEPFYTVQDLAWKFNVDEKTVWREIYEGRLKAVRVRGCVRVTPEAIEEYICEHDYWEVTGKGPKLRGGFRNGLKRFYRNLG